MHTFIEHALRPRKEQLNQQNECSEESTSHLIRLDMWLTACFSDVTVDLFIRSSKFEVRTWFSA